MSSTRGSENIPPDTDEQDGEATVVDEILERDDPCLSDQPEMHAKRVTVH
ncbi:MAG: hypothetical protein HKN43_04375 [Rhodothermales bacterium]|nr:hypothetical protein [Rhodothermales bacterium]